MLKTLDLSNNAIGDRGGEKMMEGITFNQNLEYLNLFSNKLHDSFGKKVLEVLADNRSLTKINLRYNTINLRYIHEIQKYEEETFYFFRLLHKNKVKGKELIIPKCLKECRMYKVDLGDYGRTMENFEALKLVEKDERMHLNEENLVFDKLQEEEMNKEIVFSDKLTKTSEEYQDVINKCAKIDLECENLEKKEKIDDKGWMKKIRDTALDANHLDRLGIRVD
jgi:hypothetical protein